MEVFVIKGKELTSHEEKGVIGGEGYQMGVWGWDVDLE